MQALYRPIVFVNIRISLFRVSMQGTWVVYMCWYFYIGYYHICKLSFISVCRIWK